MSSISVENQQDVLTVLTTLHPNLLATKSITKVGDGYKVTHYSEAKTFRFRQQAVRSFEDLATKLEALSKDPWSFLIRGKFVGTDPAKSLRRLYPRTSEPATVERASRRWFAVDFDAVEVSGDPTDGQAVAEQLRLLLPESFHNAACWWSLTSSAGIKPGGRMRMVFWLDRALDDISCKILMVTSPVDGVIYAATQPIYFASPVFNNCDDPIDVRTGTLLGGNVAVPEIKTPPVGHKARVDVRSKEWKWTGPEEYLDQILNALKACPEADLNDFGTYGRHMGLFEAALRLAAYWIDMELDPEEGRWLIREAVEEVGLSGSEVDRIISNGYRAYKPFEPEGSK